VKRILFVDSDRNAARSLQGLVDIEQRGWTIAVASSSAEAVDLLERQRWDVVVTEWMLPGIDGASLLAAVQEHSPATVRLVLSAATQSQSRFRAVSIAHQFLSKPADPVLLRNVILRMSKLQELLHGESVRGMIAGLSSLPSVPRLYNELQRKLEEEDTGLAEIAAIIERDPAMTAKLLQVVNSAYFGLPRQITSVREAASFLGIATVRNLILAVGVFRSFSDYERGLNLWIEALQAHSLLTAHIAARMFVDRRLSEDAFMAAVLHDTGKLILATQMPKHLRQILAAMRTQGAPMHVVERELLGVTHAEIGGYLMGIWGLPYHVVEAVAFHHAPSRDGDQLFDTTAAVYIANILANEHARPGVDVLPDASELDTDYVEALGVADRIPAWRKFVNEEMLTRR
jgi:HD-like signal output (HDOD) protein